MKKVILLVTLLCIFKNVFTQTLFFIGDKSYKATRTWFFEGNGSQFEYYGKDASIQIAKSGSTGLFVISTRSYNAASGIKGSIRVYLDDASTIVLSKLASKDYVDQYSTVAYILSSNDLNKLMSSNINTIRFNTGFSGDLKGSTVSNRYDDNPDPIIYNEVHWNTSSEIMKLFN